MLSPAPRRRILYIRHQRTIAISDAYRMNQDEWVETLSALADVTVQDSDFDMDEVCDRIRPDFIIYESPFFFAAPLNIKNVHAHAQIPRLGFQMQDPYCSIRVKFLRTIEAMNIDWMFTHMTETALRQSPELKGRTFSVSLLFDDRVFHDYGLSKDIPVSVFGGFMVPEIYNWRVDTARALPEHFPTLIYTHPGYQKPIPRHKFEVTGEAYARLLNRSHFSIADSTHFDCLVRKHLEIPACGSVLIAPDAAVMRPYGFRDMENCILGEGSALFDKIAAVADDPALYEKIRHNGHKLVHEKYSRQHWRGILDFYEVLRTLQPGETIRQQGILGPFIKMPAASAPPDAIIAAYPDSTISAQFNKWMQFIHGDEGINNENSQLSAASGWLHHMGEPHLLIGIMLLLKGDPMQARTLLMTPQNFRTTESGFIEYDPVEIAWLSLVAALTGDSKLQEMTRREASVMRHISLRRMLWLGKVLAAGGDTSNPPQDVLHALPDDQLSIHWAGQMDIKQWLSVIARILAANGQAGLLKP